jgi:ATP-dependent DNA helicase RecQ
MDAQGGTNLPKPALHPYLEWRAATAKEKSVPAYVVFHDSTMRQIAEDQPVDLDGLAGISGIGQAKLASYGGEVLRILAGEGGDGGLS